ncbi:MAG: Asp-tRNA(Asn)/Glu-tRNA(Gln) amidotransferase subunit GatB [Bacteroidetes bacterium]|nr:MAG: Asp-tRNA(Asn)/Glu-tRNA(Gln) amidotransferase subunit GatB [Bacteroidota bacterium]
MSKLRLSAEIRQKYQAVIGLEVHVQLQVKSKIFATEAFTFGSEPNEHISVITLAHPGALPSINGACVQQALKMGLATHCHIPTATYFARKNYFYPDLPKGYQLSQAENPICQNGYLDVPMPDGGLHRIRIERIHLEEDAGKSIHDLDERDTLIDLNRAGAGLIELVTYPDLRSADEACAFMAEIRKLVRYLGVGDGNMEQGNLRCDANVSVMLKTATEYGTRVEVKNLNSINYLGKAINYEIERQIALIENGGEVRQSTRTWQVSTGTTQLMRDKETADDYRYFPEPDLQPLRISREQLAQLQEALPVLPAALYERYTQELGLSYLEAMALVEQASTARYFDALLEQKLEARVAYNWLMGPVKSYLNEHQLETEAFPVEPARLAALIRLVEGGKVSHNAARERLLPAMMLHAEAEPAHLARELNVLMESNTTAIAQAMEALMQEFPDEVARYRNGRKGLMGFFVGKIMKAFKGKANPKEVNQVVKSQLEAKN